MSTTLDQISEAQANKATTANEVLEALSAAGLFGIHRSTTSALTFGYYGGELWNNGVLTTIADGTLALTASVTNYVEATYAGAVSKNTTGFTAGLIPLYELVTNGTGITTVTDRRICNLPMWGYLSKSVAGGAGTTVLTAAEARVQFLKCTGALTGNRNVELPATNWLLMAENATSGAFTLTFKTNAGTGIAVTQGKRAFLWCDGTDIYSTITDIAAIGSMTSAQLAAVVSDETGTGALVFANTPTLVTPNIGAATGSSLNIGSGALTAGAGSFTTGAFSGKITSTVGNNNVFLDASSATTGYLQQKIANTSGTLYTGVENSAGGTFIVGSTGYDGAIAAQSGLSISANGGATLHARISSAGAVTIPGTLGVTGITKISTPTAFLNDNTAFQTYSATLPALEASTAGGATQDVAGLWNNAASGDNQFLSFYTEASPTRRGSITYNRGGGLVAYNTTSGREAKFETGPIEDAIARTMQLRPIRAQMVDAEYPIDTFIADELFDVVPESVTGRPGAVNLFTGRRMHMGADVTKLIPLLAAAVQNHERRLSMQGI